MEIRTIPAAGYSLWENVCIEDECIGNGSIELELGWQLCAVPIEFGYWDSSSSQHIHDGITVAKFKNYILDQITDLYGTGVVQVANTYTGDAQAFYSYVVGSTPASSPNNFQLIYDDGLSKEVSGFWVKIIGPAAPYIITWGE